MIIDSHVHIYSYPSFRDLSKHIRTMEDAIAFRTRYPDLYKCNLTEQPIDSTDDLVAENRRLDIHGADATHRLHRLEWQGAERLARRHD